MSKSKVVIYLELESSLQGEENLSIGIVNDKELDAFLHIVKALYAFQVVCI